MESAELAGEIATAAELQEGAEGASLLQYRAEEQRARARVEAIKALRGASRVEDRNADAREAWTRLRRLVGEEHFERVGRELAKFCVDHWPSPGKRRKRLGPRPAETIATVERAVKRLRLALSKSPALEKLSALHLLPDAVADMLTASSPFPKSTQRRTTQAAASAVAELRQRLLSVLLMTSSIDVLDELIEVVKGTLTADEHGNLRRGDSDTPYNEFAFEVVDILSGKRMPEWDAELAAFLLHLVRRHQAATAKIAARLTSVVYSMDVSADALRKTIARSDKTA